MSRVYRRLAACLVVTLLGTTARAAPLDEIDPEASSWIADELADAWEADASVDDELALEGDKAAAGSNHARACGAKCRCRRSAASMAPLAREPLSDLSYLEALTEMAQFDRGCLSMPITGGAWHWFHQSLNGAGGGYGIPGIRDTYFWYINADPRLSLRGGQSLGGHLELRLRENGTFRSFISEQVWPWEAYAYWSDPDRGTLKGGLLYKRFGLFWDGVFFGNAPYFDGMKLDADYGLSWESTAQVDDGFQVARYAQFFFHEDSSNGSFGGADPESVVDYTERNTGVVQMVPTWTLSDGSILGLGMSGLVGQISSRRPDLEDETVSAYGIDLSLARGRWLWFIEGQQTFGVLNPVRYVSGGPSNRITNFLGGVHYTRGPVTYRVSYSNSLDANPDGRQNMVLAGVTVTLTKHVDLYLEYVNHRIDENAVPAINGFVFHSIEYVLNWHF